MSRLMALAVVLVFAGCATGSREWPPDSRPAAARVSRSDERTLERTLARFGFRLTKEETCEPGLSGPAAEYTNIPDSIFDTPEAGVIFASQSQVWCVLHHGPRWGLEVGRRRIGEDVVFRLLNAECSIYESNPWHIEWLGRAFRVLWIEAATS